MEGQVVSIQDVIDCGACADGVREFVAEHGVIAMPIERLAKLTGDQAVQTPCDGLGDGDGHGNGNGDGYGFGHGNGFGYEQEAENDE